MPVISKPTVDEDIDALLDEVAQERNLGGDTIMTDADANADTRRRDSYRNGDRNGDRYRDRDRSRDRYRGGSYRDRDRNRSRDRYIARQDRYRESNSEGRDSAETDRRQRDGSRPRSSKDADTEEGEDRYRRDSSRDRNGYRRGYHRGGAGDYYSGGGRARSRSPRRDRGYDDRRESRRDRDDDRRVEHRRRTVTPEVNDDERDKRTVFVQQITARAETRHLRDFFARVGPVIEAQIVKDRVTGRSKGVGYVEFKNEESVAKAIELTGQKLKGVPIIASYTEAEKNRVSRAAGEGGNVAVGKNGAPFHRLFIGNIHFSVEEHDLEEIFRPYGELEQVVLQRDADPPQRSRGYGHIQFVDPEHAKAALQEMNGFELAGRQIRVGLGNDKFTPESTAHLLRNFPQQTASYQGSAFSGAGGRGAYAGGTGGVYDRSTGRDDRGISGASALDDTDMSGVNFKQVDRNKLMRNLARNEIDIPVAKEVPQAQRRAVPKVEEPKSRCIKIQNAFDPDEEFKQFGADWTALLDKEVKEECDKRYGRVVHLSTDPNSEGDIYVKFDSKAGAEKAFQGLNGRHFNNRVINALYVVEKIYNSIYPAAEKV